MPKVIKGLRQKIIDQSEILFITYPYEKVDMRKIAKQSSIAVGTLYNYFPNKWDLYIESIKSSWVNTMEMLSEIVESDEKNKDRLFLYIDKLYREILLKKSMSKNLFIQQMKEGETKKDCLMQNLFKDTVVKQVQKILRDNYKIEVDEKKSSNIMKIIFGIIPTTINQSEKEEIFENVQFIFDVVDSYIVKKMI